MNRNEFRTLLSSWGRLSDTTLEPLMKALPAGAVKPDMAGHGLLSVFGVALGMEVSDALALGAMSLETDDPASDPLMPAEVMAFSGLLSSTVGWNTIDGYLNFGETLGRSMERTRIVADITLQEVRLEIHGETPLGIVAASEQSTGRTFSFRFTKRGVPVRREGMLRTCAVDVLTLRGIGYMLDASDVFRRAKEIKQVSG